MLDLDAASATADTQKRTAAYTERSLDKAAIAYLIASGATAVVVTGPADFIAICCCGNKIAADAVAVFWIKKEDAIGVARRARKLAGANPDRDDAIIALKQAASDLRVTLTPHSTVSLPRCGLLTALHR